MGRLVFYYDEGKIFAYEGDPSECAEVVRRLYDDIEEKDSLPRVEMQAEHNIELAPIVQHITERKSRRRLVNARELRAYITSRNQYAHTFTEIMDRFLGERLSVMNPAHRSRYKNLSRKLGDVRREIELKEGGKFEEEWVRIQDPVSGKSVRTKLHVFVKGVSEESRESPDFVTHVTHGEASEKFAVIG
jgi:hypothetical protein